MTLMMVMMVMATAIARVMFKEYFSLRVFCLFCFLLFVMVLLSPAF